MPVRETSVFICFVLFFGYNWRKTHLWSIVYTGSGHCVYITGTTFEGPRQPQKRKKKWIKTGLVGWLALYTYKSSSILYDYVSWWLYVYKTIGLFLISFVFFFSFFLCLLLAHQLEWNEKKKHNKIKKNSIYCVSVVNLSMCLFFLSFFLFLFFINMWTALAPVSLAIARLVSIRCVQYTYVWRWVGMWPTRRFTRLHYSDLVALAANWFSLFRVSPRSYSPHKENKKKQLQKSNLDILSSFD